SAVRPEGRGGGWSPDELVRYRLDRFRLLLRGRPHRNGAAREIAGPSSGRGFQGCREARDGPDRHYGRAGAQLLIASANSSYDRQSSELKTLSTNILLLDRTLKFYGIGAKEARDGLRDGIVQTHNRIWSREGVRSEKLGTRASQ